MTIEKEIETRDNDWFQMRVMPYRTVDNIIDGVVLTFFDISVIKKAQDAIENSQNILEDKIKERTADLKKSNYLLKKEVDERKESEKGLRRLAAVVKDSNDAITVQDLKGNIIAWNRGAEKMYGWKEVEALSMNIRDIVPKDRKSEALVFVQKLQEEEEEEVESFETKRVTKDGRELDVWLVVTKLVDKAGRTTAIATTERDITERGKA